MTLAPVASRQHRGPRTGMSPVYRWDPYRNMEDLNEHFNRMVRMFLGDTMAGGAAGSWLPAALPVDVEEKGDAYVVDIDLPNVQPEELDLEIRGEELHLTGRHPQRDREGVVRRQNRPMGDFEYIVDLPNDVDPHQVEAAYDNGVLTVMVAKTPDAQPRKIEIRATQPSRETSARRDQKTQHR
jgi:HSP20 family protein